MCEGTAPPPRPSPATDLIPKRADGRTELMLVSSNSCIGGVEKVVLNLLKNLPRDKYYITLAVTELKGVLHEEYAKYSDECYYFGSDAGESFRMFLTKKKFNIIHIFNSMLALVNMELMHPAKIIVSLFGDYREDIYWFRMRKEAFIASMDRIYAITTDNPVNVGLFEDFPMYLPNGIPFPTEPPHKEWDKRPVVVWSGRDSGEKRPPVLIKTAMAMPEVMFLVAIADFKSAGEGSTAIAALKQMPNVHVVVNATEQTTREMFECAWIYLNTSVMEGTPIAFLEALSYGCVPVVSGVGNMPDTISKIGYGVYTEGDTYQIQSYRSYISKAIDVCRIWGDTVAATIKEKARELHDISHFMETIYKLYSDDPSVLRDKTRLLLKAKQMQREMVSTNDRVKSFLKRFKANEFKSRVVIAENMYRALLDLDIKSDHYWNERINNPKISDRKLLEEIMYIYKYKVPHMVHRADKEYIDEMEALVKAKYPGA